VTPLAVKRIDRTSPTRSPLPIEEVRALRHEICRRVEQLIEELDAEPPATGTERLLRDR
jgi:hypothetical protein